MVDYLCRGLWHPIFPLLTDDFMLLYNILELQIFNLFIYLSAFFWTNFQKIIELQVFIYKPAP